MNLFVLFFLIEILLVIIVSLEIAKKYNTMLNEKFNYLKIKIHHLEGAIEKLNNKNKVKNSTKNINRK
jgi:hypothetical protein